MSEVDARGLSCPQPVLMTINAIKTQQSGQLEVRVDTQTSRENVSRAAENQGWTVNAVEPDNGGYRLILTKD